MPQHAVPYGLAAEYYDDPFLGFGGLGGGQGQGQGQGRPVPAVARVDRVLDFRWGAGALHGGRGAPTDYGSVRWSGAVRAPGTLLEAWTGQARVPGTAQAAAGGGGVAGAELGLVTFVLDVGGAGGGRLWLDGSLLIDRWDGGGGCGRATAVRRLQKGALHSIVVEYKERRGGDARVALRWSHSAAAAKATGMSRRSWPLARGLAGLAAPRYCRRVIVVSVSFY